MSAKKKHVSKKRTAAKKPNDWPLKGFTGNRLSKEQAAELLRAHPTEIVALASLKPHPRNYRAHPSDQIAHIKQSLQTYGWYRPIIVAQESTILAGHGLAIAARELGLTEALVIRMPFGPNDAKALKLLTADNEISKLADIDDRALSELLKEIGEGIDGLLGTGYDEAMLANLVLVTRTEEEIKDRREAADWSGMPEFEQGREDADWKLVVSFESEDDRESLMKLISVSKPTTTIRKTFTCWWPEKARGWREGQFKEAEA